jgi:hypothetical protein
VRRCLGTDYWLPRCLAGGGPEPFQAPGAVRRDSSPSKTPHLQVWTLLTRPDRRRRGGRSLSRPRRSSGFLSWGFKDAPPSISARCVRSWRGPPRGGSPSARERPSPQRLPSLPFFPASTVCSAACLAGLCASRVLGDAVLRQRRPAPGGVSPATDHGVHAVSAPAAMPTVVDPLGTSVSLSADPQGSPAGRPRSQVLPRSCPTLRSVVPRQQPSHRHRWALPSRRYRPLRLSWCGCEPRHDFACVCRPQGLDPLPSPERGDAVTSMSAPVLPWACS